MDDNGDKDEDQNDNFSKGIPLMIKKNAKIIKLTDQIRDGGAKVDGDCGPVRGAEEGERHLWR